MLAYFSFQFFLLMKDFHNNLLIFLLVFLCWLGNNFLLFPFNFFFFFFFHQSNLPTYFEKLFLSKKYIFLQTGKKVADKTGFLFRLKIKINCINLISYSFVINEQSPISSISFLSSKQDKKVYQFNNFCIVIFCFEFYSFHFVFFQLVTRIINLTFLKLVFHITQCQSHYSTIFLFLSFYRQTYTNPTIFMDAMLQTLTLCISPFYILCIDYIYYTY